MPLRDHTQIRDLDDDLWRSFLCMLMSELAGTFHRPPLRPRYRANLAVKSAIRTAEHALDMDLLWVNPGPDADYSSTENGLPRVYPAMQLTMPTLFHDTFEVQIYDTQLGMPLVGVIAAPGPRQKDSKETRELFARRCATYLQTGVCVVVLDFIADRPLRVHNDIVAALGQSAQFHLPESPFLGATSYRPVHRKGENVIDFWSVTFATGEALPDVQVPLGGGYLAQLDMETIYEKVCESARFE